MLGQMFAPVLCPSVSDQGILPWVLINWVVAKVIGRRMRGIGEAKNIEPTNCRELERTIFSHFEKHSIMKSAPNKVSLLRMFPDVAGMLYVLQLRRALRDCRTVLDVGCGSQSPLRYVWHLARTVGLDSHAATLDKARSSGTHAEYCEVNIRHLANAFPAGAFDACVALDVVEHLSKEDGALFLDQLERIACRRVVIFTPNGFLPQGNIEEGDYQKHLAGWSAEEMSRRGCVVRGAYGLKILRGEYHKIRFRPKWLWVLLSVLSDICYARFHPWDAAALFCVKRIDHLRLGGELI